MLTPNRRIDQDAVAVLVDQQFPGRGGRPRFAPAGADSWCYRMGDLWVSVRRDFEGHHPAAYEAARELRDGGLEFVLAPLRGRDGCVVHAAGDYPVVVSEYLDLRPMADGPPATAAELDEIAAMLTRLHDSAVSAAVPVETYAFPFADRLAGDLAVIVGGTVASGPYSERLERLMTDACGAIEAMWEEMLRLGGTLAERSDEMVVTHGDVSAGNVHRHDGRLLLGDWSGAMRTPRERDWYRIQHSFDIRGRVRSDTMRYYELRWWLTEIAEYTAHFVAAHAGDADDRVAWRELLHAIPVPDVSLTLSADGSNTGPRSE